MIFTQHQIHKAPSILGRDPAGNVLVRFDDGVRLIGNPMDGNGLDLDLPKEWKQSE
jgi:hypothetical protein